MNHPHPQTFNDLERCVDATIARVGKHIVLGLPVAIGKPNELVNAFVKRALADQSIRLTIFTALSLRLPRWKSDLERRFLQPFVERVFGNYSELEYVRLLERDALPANIEVNEFFLEPGAWLRNGHLQQNYLSANYTHVARDLIARGVNVVAQLVAEPGNDSAMVNPMLSLSCNPDLTVDLLPHIAAQRAAGQPFVLIGQVHGDLPYMYGDAELPRATFDFIVQQPSSPLFCPPNMPIGTTDYLIALYVSALIKDGGTLQLGIGELGDAIVYALKLRHEHPSAFAALVNATDMGTMHAGLLAEVGGVQPFAQGLYACTEMFVDGFVDLYRAGILKRRVYSHALLQQLLDDGNITEAVDETTLIALAHAGLERLSRRDFQELQTAGVFRNDAHYLSTHIVAPDGTTVSCELTNPDERRTMARCCLGTRLRNGKLLHGGFYFGPKAFYAALRDMPDDERRQFAMQRISFVNELYGADQALKVAQRRHARFVNTTMMVTGLGAAVSDGLANGEVVSGIGGQYNFVAMAHALPDARSILCARSTRTARGRTESNIVWNYGHTSIPRHLRDIVITEYGIADLRGRTDCEVIAALVQIMDARFQDDFVAQAKRSGKLSSEYRIPESAGRNTPEHAETLLQPHRQRGLFGTLPFGSDFTDDELIIAKALKRLQAATATRVGRASTLTKALFAKRPDANIERLLSRLQLSNPVSLTQRLERCVVASALRNVLT